MEFFGVLLKYFISIFDSLLQVREMLPSFTQYLRSTGQEGMELTDMPIHYHVEGPINAVYSEILLNTICEYG